MGKPSVILTSQFTTPEAKSFTNYLRYMTRKDALKEKKQSLTNSELRELDKIESALEAYDMELGQTVSTSNVDNELSEKEREALRIIQKPEYFKESQTDFKKYISYMGRQYALENKEARKVEEEKELSVVRKKIFGMVNAKEYKEEKEHSEVKQGVFSLDKEQMTSEDIKQVNKIVSKAQKNGSIFYQDVISFDNDFLVREGIYNPKKDEIDEKRIQNASRKMMEKMFEDEQIDSGYWFASIHRNTDHIHIHFGTVEKKNTRPIVTVKEDGVEYQAPKGKRKQKTIDNMKSTFANSLIDRTSELSRISDLRNSLVEDIRKSYSDKKNKKEVNLLQDIYKELPSNKNYWQYGSKHLTNETREKIDLLTNSLMKNNKHFKEYIEKTEEESLYREELFGDSKRDEKDYASNKKQDINKRMGNALLKEMRKGSVRADKNKEIFMKEKQKNTGIITLNYRTRRKKVVFSKANLYRLKKAIKDDYEKYRAEREHEMVEEKIKSEQERNRL